jgi:hypothetical protein
LLGSRRADLARGALVAAFLATADFLD